MILDQVFQAFMQVIPYSFFAGIMAITIIFEFLYTFFESVDML